MDFVIQWLSYLGAFLVGSALAWLITVMSIKRTSKDVQGASENGVRP
jgi:uncharacterized membrane protein ArfB